MLLWDGTKSWPATDISTSSALQPSYDPLHASATASHLCPSLILTTSLFRPYPRDSCLFSILDQPQSQQQHPNVCKSRTPSRALVLWCTSSSRHTTRSSLDSELRIVTAHCPDILCCQRWRRPTTHPTTRTFTTDHHQSLLSTRLMAIRRHATRLTPHRRRMLDARHTTLLTAHLRGPLTTPLTCTPRTGTLLHHLAAEPTM